MTDIRLSEAPPVSGGFRRHMAAFFWGMTALVLIGTWFLQPYLNEIGIISAMFLGVLGAIAYPDWNKAASTASPQSHGSERFWFWTIISLMLVGLFSISTWDLSLYSGAATMGIIGLGVALLHWIAHTPVIPYLWSNKKKVALYAAIYLLVGASYSVLRWEFFASDWRNQYDTVVTEYMAKNVPDDQKLTEEQKYELRNQVAWIGPKPTYDAYESKIKGWIFFWPFSFIHWTFSDFVMRVIDWVYNLLGYVYTWQSERYLRGVTID